MTMTSASVQREESLYRKLAVVFGCLYALYSIAVIQSGSVGPFAFLKPVSVRAAILVGLVCATASLVSISERVRVQAGDRAAEYFFEIRNLGRWRLIVWILVFLGVSVVVQAFLQAPSTQFLVLILYILPLVCISIAPIRAVVLAFWGVVFGSALQLIASWCFGPAHITLSGVGQLSGGIQPNVIGLLACFVVISGTWLVLYCPDRGCRLRLVSGVILVCLGLAATYLSVSRTAVVSAIPAIALLVFFRLRLGARVGIGALVPLVVVCASGLSSVSGGLANWFVRGDEQSLDTLTGRTTIWSLAWQYWLDRPFFGWGFGGLYTEGSTAGSFLQLVPGVNAHSLILQLMVETGIIGVVMVFVGIVALIWRGKSLPRSDLTLIGAMAVVLAINGIGSASFSTLGVAALMWFTLVGVVCLFNSRDAEADGGIMWNPL